MAIVDTDRIGALARPLLESLGCDLEGVAMGGPAGGRQVRITVDRDGGMSLDDVAEASRLLSAAFDDAGVLGAEPYDLEISTPGVDRPLTLPRHWRRNRGRKVTVHRTGSADVVSGRIGESGDEAVTLVHNDKGRFTETTVVFADVERAVLEVDFTRPGAAELRRCGLDEDEIARRREPVG